MKKLLIVVDYQKDFVDGSLGFEAAIQLDDYISELIDQFHKNNNDVLFTFDSEETGKKYVLYYDGELEEPQVYSSIYDDDGHLYPVDTPEEWDMIEEVFNSFLSEEE